MECRDGPATADRSCVGERDTEAGPRPRPVVAGESSGSADPDALRLALRDPEARRTVRGPGTRLALDAAFVSVEGDAADADAENRLVGES